MVLVSFRERVELNGRIREGNVEWNDSGGSEMWGGVSKEGKS
jgi:hypothetical protein